MATATNLKIEPQLRVSISFSQDRAADGRFMINSLRPNFIPHVSGRIYSGGWYFFSQTSFRHGSRCLQEGKAFLLLQPIIDLTLKEPRANVDEAMCRLNWQSIGADAEENILMVPVSQPKIKHAHNKTGGKGRKQTPLFSMACTVIIDPLFFSVLFVPLLHKRPCARKQHRSGWKDKYNGKIH